MVGGYDASTGSLELRQPEKIFAPLAWLLAGPLNPAEFFAHLPWNERSWDMPFDAMMWATSVAIPLSVGCAAALFYLRGGGFGFMTLLLIAGLSTLAACAVTGPLYTYAISVLREFGIYWTIFPVSNFDEAIVTSGTFIRLGLLLLSMPLLPAAILLRVIAFRRQPRKQRPVAASTLGF
jgi:hypothetical protein